MACRSAVAAPFASPASWRARPRASRRSGSSGRTRSALRKVAAARPDHPVYRYHLARGLEQSGDLQEAAAQYRAAILLAPSAPFPWKGLGLLLARLGDSTGALEALERAAALDTKGSVMDATALSLLASLRRGAKVEHRPR